MSVEVWPRLSPEELQKEIKRTQDREIDWLLNELRDTLAQLKQGLQDCYQLLAPTPTADQGNTLVVSTPRNEIVKGHITRVGTQIVKGTIHIRLRTLPHQTLTINPEHPITIAPLDSLYTLLTHSIDLLTVTISYTYQSSSPPLSSSPLSPSKSTETSLKSSPADGPLSYDNGRPDTFLATQLRALAQALSDASALLKGPVLATDPAWSSRSVALSHFEPLLPPAISFYIGLQDSQLVLWLRSLEPIGMPVNIGMKFALALGTTRRLEHDEAEKIFTYCCEDGCAKGLHPPSTGATAALPTSFLHDSDMPKKTVTTEGPVEVYVREKVRIESADPSLLSLSAKLLALSNSLLLARQNLAAVMGEEMED